MTFFPQASDNFNRANANPIGGNWTTITGQAALQIVSNQVQPSTTANSVHGAYYNQLSWGADQYSEVKCIACVNGASFPQIGTYVRLSTSALTGYYIVIISTASNPFPGNTNVQIHKVVAGSDNVLFATTAVMAVNDKLGIGVVGNIVTGYLNGVAIPGLSGTDSAIVSGVPGLFADSAGHVVSDTTIDDWVGSLWATVAGAPTFSPVNGHYTFPQTVTITSPVTGGTIFYTTDGSTPTAGSSSIASGGTVVLNGAATIKAFARQTGVSDSSVVASTYAAYFNPWVPQGKLSGFSSGGNANVIYDGSPQIISPNPDGKVLKMWYQPDDTHINYAESTDGLVWTKHPSNPILTPAISGAFPRFFHNKAGNQYWMSITSDTQIQVYTSPDTDGINWTRRNATALLPNTQAWEGGKIWQLAVVGIDANGTWWGTYQNGLLATYDISTLTGQASSPDGITWTKNPANPVINFPSGNLGWTIVDGKFYGYTQSVAPPIAHAYFGNSEIFRFSCSNPAGPYVQLTNPVYYSTISSEFVNVQGGNVDDPSVVEANGNCYMYFTVTNAGIAGGVAAAVATGVTLAQLVASVEGVQNVPIFTPRNPLVPSESLNNNIQASDNFQRADANPIGGTWAQISSGGAFGALKIVSNTVEAASVGVNCDAYYNQTLDNDQWASAVIGACANTSQFGVCLRQDTGGAGTEYQFFWTGTLGTQGTWHIVKVVNGSFSSLGSGNYNFENVVAGHTVTGAIIGNNLYMFINGNLVSPAIVDSAIVSGAAGMHINAATAVGDVQITGWSAGNFVSAAKPAPPNPTPNNALLNSTMGFFIGALASGGKR